MRKSWMILPVVFMVLLMLAGCKGSRPFSDNTPPELLTYAPDTTGLEMEIHFQRGRYHNHPLMVFWIEDENGNYLKTLYIARSIGKGVFSYGAQAEGHWMPGEIQRPASLPYWAHKRGVKNEMGNYIPSPSAPMPDAVTGATPQRDFVLRTFAGLNMPERFILKMEINQTWDFNEYWTDGKFPGNQEYVTSCQPALVYEATIDVKEGKREYLMSPVGHSHYDGSDGSLTRDLGTMTTALEIVKEVKVVLP